MFTIRETHLNDTTIVDGEEVTHDRFEITDETGEMVSEIWVETAEDAEPYLEALHAAGWHFTDGVNFDGGQVARN